MQDIPDLELRPKELLLLSIRIAIDTNSILQPLNLQGRVKCVFPLTSFKYS